MSFMNISILLASFAAMEFVAWLTHKYVMHGILWRLHRDHHQKDHNKFRERNDFFFLIFAAPGILFIHFGVEAGVQDPRLWIGLGISLYGLAYVLVHDLFIHQRIRFFKRTNNPYLRAMRRAHRIHHKYLDKEDGECFGMLWAPRKYWPKAQRIKPDSA